MNTVTHDHIYELMDPTTADSRRHHLFKQIAEGSVTEDLLYETVLAVRERMIRVDLDIGPSNDPIDTCGTGGSGFQTINTSTLVAFILAAGGVKVAKHGGRAATGKCGSADVLAELKVNVSLSVDQERRIYDKLGIVFLSARDHNPGLKAIAPLRTEHRAPTVFNLAAPLCNPAGVKRQMIGTTTYKNAGLVYRVLKRLGSGSSMVVAASSGLDEVSIMGHTLYLWDRDGRPMQSVFHPKDLGVKCADASEFLGGNPDRNKHLFYLILAGRTQGEHDKRLELVLTNAAFGFYAAGAVEDLKKGYEMARRVVVQGSALRKFNEYLIMSNQ